MRCDTVRSSQMCAGAPRSAVFIGVMLASLLLVGRAQGEPSPDAKTVGSSLRVRVVDASHPERGVPNAQVRVWRRSAPGDGISPYCVIPPRGETGADGRTTIQRVIQNRRGPYERWTKDANLYVQVTASGFTLARRLFAAADWPKTELTVELAHGMVLSGTVRKSDGTPAVGVRVRASQPQQWGWYQDSHVPVTDHLGAFRASGLFPGPVSLRATLHERDAVWVRDATVEAGRVDVGIRLSAEPAQRQIRFRIKGADGSTVKGARWFTEDKLNHPWRSAHRGVVENGAFVLPADPDVRWVTITDPFDENDSRLPWATTVVGPFDAQGGVIDVVMPRGVTVTGTVRDDQGEPLDDVSVFATPIITDGDQERPARQRWAYTGSDANGQFRLDRVTPGRVEVWAHNDKWSEQPLRVTAPCDGVALVMRPWKLLQGRVQYSDGTPAPDAVVYAMGGFADSKRWTRIGVKQDGTFSMHYDDSNVVALRAGLAPTGVEDMAASEVEAGPDVDLNSIVLVAPRSGSLVVRVPDWPASAAGAARLANGPPSRGHAQWIIGGTATFAGIDRRTPVSVYCGPLPDGRIAFAPNVPSARTEVSLPLVPSRSIRGRAHGFPADARPHRAWADTRAFEAPGHAGGDGTFLVRGVPPGACRVCIVFKRGEELWAGSARATESSELINVELNQMDQRAFDAWISARPPH